MQVILLHNTFNLLMDFWDSKYKKPNTDPLILLRLWETRFSLSLSIICILNSSLTFLFTFFLSLLIRLISLLLIHLSLSSKLALTITEIFSMGHLSWNLLSSIFPLIVSLSLTLTLVESLSLAPLSHHPSPKSLALTNSLT